MLALLLVAAFVGIMAYQWKYSGSRASTPPPNLPPQQQQQAQQPKATQDAAAPAPSEPVAAVREHTDSAPAASSEADQKAAATEPAPSPAEPSASTKPADRKAESAKPAPQADPEEAADLEPAAQESKGGGTPETASTQPAPLKLTAADKKAASLLLKAEQYLYGRGVPRSCDQALIYLRAAAHNANPKARSRLGALYATGQCVPQDRAIAYRYFTQALNSGQGNVWLERNRAMLWREMSEEERQRATQ